MRNLLRCRRGSVAFAMAIALLPLIGFVALGGEAASWYVTKQKAQNAADAAAYSGALRLACPEPCAADPAHDYQYRAKQFAAQNGFCNAGETAYPGSACASLATDVSQKVAILSTTCGGMPCVQATVSQTQPTYLASVLGFTSVSPGATAAAVVDSLTPPCVLALEGSISFQGSPNLDARNCGVASNSAATNALDFTGGGMTIDSSVWLAAQGGCTGSTTWCGKASTYQPPIENKFSALDADWDSFCPSMTAPCGLTPSSKSSATCPPDTLVPYTSATPCANDGITVKPENAPPPLTSGVYFISGNLTLDGNVSFEGTDVTLVLLPEAQIILMGSTTMNLTPPASAPPIAWLPPAFQADAALFDQLAIYDMSNIAVSFNGTSDITINSGNIYAPKAAVTFQGNSKFDTANCGKLIAKSIIFNGNATFHDGCPDATKFKRQIVRLWQSP